MTSAEPVLIGRQNKFEEFSGLERDRTGVEHVACVLLSVGAVATGVVVLSGNSLCMLDPGLLFLQKFSVVMILL
jgi:hypothetical protein